MTQSLQYLRAVALALGLTFTLHGFAQAPAALAVSATVASTCVLVGGVLNFGSYTGTTANGSGTITATCTSGSTAYVLLDQGLNADTGSTNSNPLRRMSNGTGGFLSYGLYATSPGQTVWGNTQATGKTVSGSGLVDTLTVYGQIPGGQYTAPAGAYVDTVLVTFTF